MSKPRIQNLFYKCRRKGHQSHTCYISKHFVKLHQKYGPKNKAHLVDVVLRRAKAYVEDNLKFIPIIYLSKLLCSAIYIYIYHLITSYLLVLVDTMQSLITEHKVEVRVQQKMQLHILSYGIIDTLCTYLIMNGIL